MEKEREFFRKNREEKIDALIGKLNELKNPNSFHHIDDSYSYKNEIDGIFNLFNEETTYLAMKRFFEQTN